MGKCTAAKKSKILAIFMIKLFRYMILPIHSKNLVRWSFFRIQNIWNKRKKILHHTSIKVVIMSRLEGLYEWSFNDGRVLGFLYISIVRQMILKSLILKHFFSIFMMDGPIKTMAQNAWHSGRFSWTHSMLIIGNIFDAILRKPKLFFCSFHLVLLYL